MKIAIVGAGNAGCITALHYYKYLSEEQIKNFEIEIYHSPLTHPIEKVGQGTTLPIARLICSTLGIDWYNNQIGATFKTGILYEGWGKKQEKIFHNFIVPDVAMHLVPHKFCQKVLDMKQFKVIEKNITDPENEIDANVIFDCRGRHDRDISKYVKLINPLNSVLLSKKTGRDNDLTYTRCVATPNGWTFVIPNLDSVSYGYLYNSDITTKSEASEDFLSRFNLDEIKDELTFDNYRARNFFQGEKTFLQGNMYGFIEPLEATSIGLYQFICRQAWDVMFGNRTLEYCNEKVIENIKRIETVILWHYQYGSKYDTPFWQYAKSLPFNPDDEFYNMAYDKKTNLKEYGQWRKYNLNNWRLGVE